MNHFIAILSPLIRSSVLVGALASLVGCATAPPPRWISGVCGTSADLAGEVNASMDVSPQASGGTFYSLEVKTDVPDRGVHGFGCDLLPPSVRGRFSGSALSDSALESLATAGYAVTRDTRTTRGELQERRLMLEKAETSPLYLLYRWPDNQAFIKRAFWHRGEKVSAAEVDAFLGSWVEGWTSYKSWQSIGIGECAARFAFPTAPVCEFGAGGSDFLTRCVAPLGADGAQVVVECLVQPTNTEADEAAVLRALDRGLGLARERAFVKSGALASNLTESARHMEPNLWTRGRRHTLRSGDDRLHREALVATKAATIISLWVEWEGKTPPPQATIERFFAGFSK